MKINVTQAIIPNEKQYGDSIHKIFDAHILTNNGPQVNQLAENLKQFLSLDYIVLCANGTLGLEIAIHVSNPQRKTVITTPFSYVATVSAPLWLGCEVRFADIDEETLSIDPKKIAECLTDDTGLVLPVDVYGHPCDFESIARVAGSIPVLYDAAQAFGCSLDGKSLFNFGNFAICSMHATKSFHSGEGGFVTCHSEEDFNALNLARAFGHVNDEHYTLGINAKMSEFHASLGLSLLPEFESHLKARRLLSAQYDALLDFSHLRKPAVPSGFFSNYSYYPVIFDSEKIMLKTVEGLNNRNIFPRRYFYPSLSLLPYVEYQPCPVAEDIATRVLCLPLYSSLPAGKVEEIADTVNGILKNG